MSNRPINYSQCWEDPHILREALSINENDYVLSVTSGGDNTLALVLDKPNTIVSIDSNSAQNYLLELKISAAKALSYDEYLEFLGVVESKKREILFKKIRPYLSSHVDEWWLHHKDLLNEGVVRCGKFERFTILFAKYILPLIHSRKLIIKMLSTNNIKEQQDIYHKQWDSKKWRFFFSLVVNRFILKRFARQRGMFSYAQSQTVAEVYRNRLGMNLNSVLTKDNFFLHYSLTGEYGDNLPPYLQKEAYLYLREETKTTLLIETDNLLEYLKSTPKDTFSKFNFSDIFEALSVAENDRLWEEIIRTAKNGAVVVYWNNLVHRTYPTYLSLKIKTNKKQMSKLQAQDRVFFYDSFHVNSIVK